MGVYLIRFAMDNNSRSPLHAHDAAPQNPEIQNFPHYGFQLLLGPQAAEIFHEIRPRKIRNLFFIPYNMSAAYKFQWKYVRGGSGECTNSNGNTQGVGRENVGSGDRDL